jgi:hypothetical protein
MATYSTNLAITLPADGEFAGTWGGITNTNLGTLIEQAVSGYVDQAVSDNPATPTTIDIPNGATGVARNMYLRLTGTLTAARNVIVPTNRKLYFIYNNTNGNFAVTVKVTGLTGVSVPNGSKMLLVCNGTDIVDAVTYFSSLTTGAFSATSVTCSGALVGTVLSLTGATVSGNGLNVPAVNTLGFVSNSAQRGTVNSTGNWSYVAASTGITATFNSATNTHSVQIGDSANTKYNAGFLETPVNATTGATITPVLADSGKTFYFTGSSAPTATIPANGSVAYPVGTVLTFVNDASAAVSMNITITTDTLQLAGTGSTTLPKVLARYGVATAVKVATQKWIISGNGLT